MKPRIIVALSLSILVLALANLLPSHAQKASGAPQVNAPPPLSNPLKVALLKWYQSNVVPTTFPVGAWPQGVAFDGENIWVANSHGNSVSKLRANDGDVLGKFPVGYGPAGIVFDGANIWVANQGSASVSKLRASDGKTLGTFSAGNQPLYPAFDGSNVWVPNFTDGTVTILRASDGKNLGTVVTGGAFATVFDGTYIWVTTHGNTVVRLNQDGSNAGTFPVGAGCVGLAYDGANIWIANYESETVTKLRARDGAPLGTLNVPSPSQLAFDGSYIWVTSPDTGVVYQLRASDGAQIGVFGAAVSPAGIAFDGADIWVAATGSNIVYKF